MTTASTVSVLLPCYRSAAFVERAIESVRAQTLQRWELVACDNASDDGTYALLQRHAAQDPRIRAFRNDRNVGPVGNWRRCAELATAPLAALLFSDDWYEPAFLARMVGRLEDARVGIAYSAVKIVRTGGAAGGPESWYVDPPATALASKDFLRATYEGWGRRTPVSPGCAVARRTDLARWLATPLRDDAEFRFAAHGAGTDLRVYLQACREYPLVAHEPEPLAAFLEHSGNLTHTEGVARAYAAALFQFVEDGGFPEVSQRALARIWWALHGTPTGKRAARHLGPRGLAEVGAIVGAKAWERVRRALARASGAAPPA